MLQVVQKSNLLKKQLSFVVIQRLDGLLNDYRLRCEFPRIIEFSRVHFAKTSMPDPFNNFKLTSSRNTFDAMSIPVTEN